MTFLRGSTDAANAGSDFFLLLTGAQAAGLRGSGQGGNGAQATADAWTNYDNTNHIIRSTTTRKPYELNFATWRGAPRFAYGASDPGVAGGYSIFRGKPTFSGTWTGTGTQARAYLRVWVSTANGAAGSLAGAVISWEVDSVSNGTAIASGTVSGWANATTDTKLLTNGISLTLTLNAGEVFAAGSSSSSAILWLRGYSTTWTQGVDYYPEAGKIDTTQTLTLSNTSSGSNNYTRATDYDLVGECDANPTPGSYFGNGYAGPGVFHGVHWRTGGAPPAAGTNYWIVDANVFAAYAQVGFQSTTFYILPMDYWDVTNQMPRNACNGTASSLPVGTSNGIAAAFTSAPTSSAYINYWISVKPTKIIILVKGDNGQGLSQERVGTFQRYTPYFAAIDKNPWAIVTQGNSTDINSQFAVTGRMIYDYPYYGHVKFTNTTAYVWNSFTSPSDYTAFNLTGEIAANPNAMDGKWWLYTLLITSGRGGKRCERKPQSDPRGGHEGNFAGALGTVRG